MNWPIISSLAIFVMGVILALYLKRAASRAAEIKEEAEWRKGIDQKMVTLMTQVSPLWAAVQSKIAKDLTHPSAQFHEMDELLVKLEDLSITDAERARLHDLLRERATSLDPEVNEEERASAKLMIGVMEKVLSEAGDPSPIVDVVTVGTKGSAPGGKEEVKA